ncbi:MAG: sulfatase [Acidobacteria bacterium]|nr:sulfatase [Acidobacteriota bacterium]
MTSDGVPRRGARTSSRRVGLALLAALAALHAAFCSPRRGPGWRPNIVLVSIDTLSANSLRAYSPYATELPNVDRFATGAVRFANALTTAPWTLPAHASLLTGLYPDRHGATHTRRGVAAGAPVLAEILRDAGYRTVAFTDGVMVDPKFGFARGFERYDDRAGPSGWPHGIPRDGRATRLRKHLFDRGLAFLRSVRREDTPFFLFLHTYSVHDYFLRTPGPWPYPKCVQGRVPCGPESWGSMRRQYEVELREMDVAFGRLLDGVAAVSAHRPTLLFFVSDHGEGFDTDRRRIHHGGRLHEDLVRVPLLVAGAVGRPCTVTEPVSLVDVVPTVLDLLSLPSPPALDGRSLVPAFRGERLPPRPLFAMEHSFFWSPAGRYESRPPRETPLALAVVTGERWFIRSQEGEELYDTLADSTQRVPLGEDPARRVLARLADERGRVRSPEGEVVLDEELSEQMRALGYIQ